MVQQPKDAVMKDAPIVPRKVESVSGMVRVCSHEGCTNHVVRGGHCRRHGVKTICGHEGCTNIAQNGGLCDRHGGRKRKEGCTYKALRKGVCSRHGAKRC